MNFARSSFIVSACLLFFCGSTVLDPSGAMAESDQKSSSKPSVPASVKKGANNSEPLSSFELGKYQYCGTDNDCILAQNGCCDCANGGQDIAINKERVSAFQARFECLHVECTEKATEPPCASGVVSCINHKCRYIAEEPSSSKKKKRK